MSFRDRPKRRIILTTPDGDPSKPHLINSSSPEFSSLGHELAVRRQDLAELRRRRTMEANGTRRGERLLHSRKKKT